MCLPATLFFFSCSQVFSNVSSVFTLTSEYLVPLGKILCNDGRLKELHKGTKILAQAPFAVHSPLVEPPYPCYLKAASMEWAWLADITLLCHRAGEGGGRRAGRVAERSCGRTAGRGSFSATHCFVIVPVAFCPQLSSRKATRRDRS